METIKVLQLVSPGFGGIESYIFNHYKYMDRTKFQFDFLTQNRELENAEQYRDVTYKVHFLKTTAGQNPDLFRRQIRDIFRNGYDVLHLNSCYWTGYLLEELAKEADIKKIIVHSHSTFIDETDEEKRERLLYRHEEIKAAFSPELATDFWACSQLAADWMFGSQIPRSKIRIMKNAIELEQYQFDVKKRAEVRRELDVEQDIVLGTVGRLSYQKNQSFLIEVFAEFHQKHPNSKLIILGEGELRSELETQICCKHLEKNALLLGWKTDPASYLQAMDIFLLPSKFEGFPVSAVEASAAGLPCIVSDRITNEVEAIQLIQRRPLELSAWVTAIEESYNLYREDGLRITSEAGYDIKHQAKVLESMYMT